MKHIVNSCPLTKPDGGLLSLHEAEEDAISWLKMMVTKALAKWMNLNVQTVMAELKS